MNSYSHWGMFPRQTGIRMVAVSASDLTDRDMRPGAIVYSTKCDEPLAIIPETEYQLLNFGPYLP